MTLGQWFNIRTYFIVDVFHKDTKENMINICINKVARWWLWFLVLFFLVHDIFWSYILDPRWRMIFYRMNASQYIMLNTKNKIGNDIKKNLSILQYSSANCCTETALTALSWTSYLKLSLHTILMFILCWPDT